MPTAGFAEEPSKFDRGAGDLVSVDYSGLKIDSAGRIVIPAEMRAAMRVKPGETLTARVVDGELRIVSRAWVMRRIEQEAERFKRAHPDADLADELAASRQEEFRTEEQRWARLEHEEAESSRRPVLNE